MSVLVLGTLGHQCVIKSTKNLNNKIIDILARPLLMFGIYMLNCKMLELAMPSMQVLKFYFPIKESTIAQLEYLTVNTLIQVKGRKIL